MKAFVYKYIHRNLLIVSFLREVTFFMNDSNIHLSVLRYNNKASMLTFFLNKECVKETPFRPKSRYKKKYYLVFFLVFYMAFPLLTLAMCACFTICQIQISRGRTTFDYFKSHTTLNGL